jgi:hypothetical protein
MKSVKLTNEMLKRLVMEEAAKFGAEKSTEDAASDTEEVDADEYADALEKKIDMYKALKIEERKVAKRLATLREQKRLLLKKLASKKV